MKLPYSPVEMTIAHFDAQDVVSTSGMMEDVVDTTSQSPIWTVVSNQGRPDYNAWNPDP